MLALSQAIPDVDVLLSLTRQELGLQLLALLCPEMGMVHLNNFLGENYTPAARVQPYPPKKTAAVELAVTEAWVWLENQILLVPASGTNGQNGFRVFSRRAQQLRATPAATAAYRTAGLLDKSLLHPSITDQVWQSFVRGEYDTAAFQAMRQVEIAVREAAAADAGDPAVKVARAAFRPGVGPLADLTVPEGEQQGMMDLFAGALGALKNPHSHRIVDLADPVEAVAIVTFASQLLRIVERQRVRTGA